MPRRVSGLRQTATVPASAPGVTRCGRSAHAAAIEQVRSASAATLSYAFIAATFAFMV